MRNVFFIFCLSVFMPAIAQTDTLNRLDNNGEKVGWWLVYLDQDLKQIKDSSGATYCKLTLYTGKFDHYNMGKIGSKKFPVESSESDTLYYKGYKLLNGTYTSNYKNGKVRFELTASNGILTEYKEFYENGQIKTQIIYSNQCGTPLRCCIKQYDESGNLTFDGVNQIPQDRQ